jgi:hypothetical protein
MVSPSFRLEFQFVTPVGWMSQQQRELIVLTGTNTTIQPPNL